MWFVVVKSGIILQRGHHKLPKIYCFGYIYCLILRCFLSIHFSGKLKKKKLSPERPFSLYTFRVNEKKSKSRATFT